MSSDLIVRICISATRDRTRSVRRRGIRSTTARPIGIDRGGGGDGALHTCMRFSAGDDQEIIHHLAIGHQRLRRTPACDGTRSSSCISGISRCSDLVNAFLLKLRHISRHAFAEVFVGQLPEALYVSVSNMSRALKSPQV